MDGSSKLVISNVAAALARLGWSQAKLAARMKIAPQALNRYLTGKSSPGLEVVDAMASALGIEVKTLFESESKKIPAAQIIEPTLVESAERLEARLSRLEELTTPLEVYDLEKLCRGFANVEEAVADYFRSLGFGSHFRRKLFQRFGECRKIRD
jgi:transcriptional regulator with XRE-family HTH domain